MNGFKKVASAYSLACCRIHGALLAAVALVVAASSAQAQFDPATLPDPTDDLLTTFTDRYFSNWVTVLTVGAVALAISAIWMRIRRHAK